LGDGPISVKWFGARGDGDPPRDEAPAINQAIRVALATAAPTAIFIPPGHYHLKSPVVINSTRPLRLSGVGYGSRLTAMIAGSNPAAIRINVSAPVEVTDLQLDGTFS